MKLFAAAFVAAALLAPSYASACDEHEKSAEKKPVIKMLTVTELMELNTENKAVVFDANSPETRQKAGVIPGAKMLTSSSKFEPAKELPTAKDSKLVFYCANERCKASHKAATRAQEAGYTDISVLPAGIQGWKAAGQPTQSFNPS